MTHKRLSNLGIETLTDEPTQLVYETEFALSQGKKVDGNPSRTIPQVTLFASRENGMTVLHRYAGLTVDEALGRGAESLLGDYLDTTATNFVADLKLENPKRNNDGTVLIARGKIYYKK
ncbi:MAG: hypothetical protein ACP5NS_00620 [Candidatus Pacearchaeota archaeon]